MMQTFTGKEYLKIDIANSFGLDKELWNDRINWFNTNEHQLETLTNKAESPAMYFAGISAYRKSQKGEAIGYPISLDATASGIQILACLTGDRKAAELCNVIDTGTRADAYTHLYMAMCDKLGEAGQIQRDDTKKSVMTAFYGSTATPKRIFGEGKLLDIFYETMTEQAPGAWELNEQFLAMWDPTKYSNDWVMPDNFHVHVKVMATVAENVQFLNAPYEVQYSVNQPMENGRSLGANCNHSVDGMLVREMTRRCNYNPNTISNLQLVIEDGVYGKETSNENGKLVSILWDHYLDSGFISARILDYLDSTNLGIVNVNVIKFLIETLPAKPFEVISVHDCFRCLPNYGNDLRRQYNILLAEIAQSNLLSFLVSQMVGRIVTITKIDPDMYKEILDANYSLS